MATVKDRFEHLGLAHNNKILMIVGGHVSEIFKEGHVAQMSKVDQKEGDEVFKVCDYPEWFTKKMDFEIINFLEHYLEPKQNG